MKIKKLLTLALAVAFMLIAPMTAHAEETGPRGWVQDDYGWWYETYDEYGELTYYRDGIYTIYNTTTDEHESYYFNASGYVVKGWIKYVDEYDGESYWLYADHMGVLQTGWEKIDGTWYYFDYDYTMHAGGVRVVWTDAGERQLYFFDGAGKLMTGWIKDVDTWEYDGEVYTEEYWYYANSSGLLQTGWQKIDGYWYYFSLYDAYMYADGVHYIYNSDLEKDEYYYFDKSGRLQKGWIKEVNTYEWGDGEVETYTNWYYADSNGVVQTGWQKISGSWYYFSEWGQMYSGMHEIREGDKYVLYNFAPSGELTKGWYKGNDTYSGTYWIYSNSNGVVQTGWQKINGEWYFFNKNNGRMCADMTASVDGENGPKYHFDKNGKMTTGWHYHKTSLTSGAWIYSNSNGVVQTGWQKIDGAWYMFDKYNQGYMVAGQRWFDQDDLYDANGNYVGYDNVKYFWFRADGTMVSGWYNRTPYTTYGDWVYCNQDGSAYTGWVKSAGAWYYAENGEVYQSEYLYEYKDIINEDGEEDVEEKRYFFGRDGKMITGWYDASYQSPNYQYSDWMYANPDGTLEAQWVKSGSDWYFTGSDGYIKTDGAFYCVGANEKAPQYEDFDSYKEYREVLEKWQADHYYVFDAKGKLVKNSWYFSSNTYGTSCYYADADGKGHQGWLQQNGNWYYFINGVLQRNRYVADGCYVNENGVWVK